MMQAPGVVEFFHDPTKTSQMKRQKNHPHLPVTTKEFPSVSLVIPFELKMHKQPFLTKLLALAADNEEEKLCVKYPKEMVRPVINRMRHLIAGVHCRKDNMSICIVVSAISENVYYFSPTDELSNYFPASVA